MTEQLALLQIGVEPLLTTRQRLAFDYVAGNDGVAADEVGAWLHAHRTIRPHPLGDRCDWCARDGLSVLRSKAVAPLVTYRKSREGRLYVARNKPARSGASNRGVIATSNSDPEVNPWADL